MLESRAESWTRMKTKTNMDERVFAIADPIAKDMGLNIVRVRVQSGRRKTVQIMAERVSDGLLGIAECEALSRELTATMDVEDPIHDPFILEVSSPGLERPLTSLEDFKHYAGYKARVDLDRMVEGRKRFRGILAGIDGKNIDIDLDGEDETAQIPFEWVSEAKLLITDELIKAGQEAKDAAYKDLDKTENTSENE
jgi:ribosome maturation factor RimP